MAVPDKRWAHLCEAFKPKSRVQAVLEIWDIAGLVKGAHEGKGLGNEFLSNIQAVDAIYHCVRAFKDKDIQHVEGDVNPVRDMEIISSELRKKDLAFIQAKYEKLDISARRTNDKHAKDELACVERILNVLKEDKDIQFHHWNGKDIEFIQQYNLFTAKPVVFLVNVSVKNWLKGQNKWIPAIKEWVTKNYPNSPVLPFSAKFEEKLVEMTVEESEKYLQENNTKSQMNKIIHAGYKALKLIHYFTCGADEVKCWTIRQGTKAPQAAGVIHGDMEQGFICAETYNYKAFKKHGSEHEVKANGQYQQNGKNYEVHDGDILFFKFNKPQGKKKK